MKTKFISAMTSLVLALSCIAKDSSEESRSIAALNYRLHEWGTFTSVSGSDGRLLEGVERDVEPLPLFVHSHESNEQMIHGGLKGFAARPLKGVTVKMETPVIYFYTNQSFDAEVSVGFKGGSISQWFPSRAGGEKLPFRGIDPATRKYEDGMIDFSKPFNGSIQWKVSVEPALADWPAKVYHPQETPVWIYPRLPASALVRTSDGEVEKYLFYRGVGHFEMPVSATFTGDRAVRLANVGADSVPSLMIYERTREGMVKWQVISALAANAAVNINLDAQTAVSASQARVQVHETMAKMLMDGGLDRAEADAMILTWQASYFGAHGIRLFWVAPRSLIDRVLPLNVNPPPASMARVILGRLELLSPAWERELVARANEADMTTPKQSHPFTYERHWPAYAQRLQQLRLAAPTLKIPNRLIDYRGFLKDADAVGRLREERRVSEEEFIRMAADSSTVVYDARSDQKYHMLHIKGAKHLSLPDVTESELAKLIPDKTTRVLIYCNNNFENEPVAFASKVAKASLNIYTFNTLFSYGYKNVYELGPLIDINHSKLSFEGTNK